MSLTSTTEKTIAADLQALAVPISSLTPLPDNPRRGDTQAVARSLVAFGQRKPIVARRSDRTVIAGNHTLAAAVELGWSEIAVVWTDDDELTSAAFALADNRTAELGGYDEPALAAMIGLVRDADAGLFEATAWGGEDLSALLARVDAAGARVALTDPDAAPAPPEVPVSRVGDVWLLGPHRLVCGDATDGAVLACALDGRACDLVLTDPPYGVGIGEKNVMLESVGKGTTAAGSIDGDESMAEVEILWRAAFPAIREAMTAGCPYYVFGPQGGDLGLLLLLLLRDAGLSPRHVLIWVKNRPSFSMGRLDYDYQHEPIVYGWKPGAAHAWYANDPRTSILQADRPAASPLHPTMKPVALLAELVRNSAPFDGIVLDPFAGSGSTLIACHQEHRIARLVELSPRYCDVICERFERHVGVVPVRESDGATLSFVRPA